MQADKELQDAFHCINLELLSFPLSTAKHILS